MKQIILLLLLSITAMNGQSAQDTLADQDNEPSSHYAYYAGTLCVVDQNPALLINSGDLKAKDCDWCIAEGGDSLWMKQSLTIVITNNWSTYKEKHIITKQVIEWPLLYPIKEDDGK